MDKGPHALSVIVPVYNEGESIRVLYELLKPVLQQTGRSYEIIFVDDGSSDDTPTIVEDLARSDFQVKGIRLRRRFGKALALGIAFSQADGAIVITMDGDLQDDPAEIPRFIEKIEEGWDLVSGWKKVRHDPLERRLASKVFNAVVSRVSGLRLHDANCGYKAYRSVVLKTVRPYGELHRFIPMIAHSYGFKVCEISVRHHKRRFGATKFGVDRYFAGFFDLITTVFIAQYIRKPLHFLGRISFTAGTGGLFLLLYVAVMKFGLAQKGDRPALVIAVFLIGLSVQVILFGLVADLISNINHRTNFNEADFVEKKF